MTDLMTKARAFLTLDTQVVRTDLVHVFAAEIIVAGEKLRELAEKTESVPHYNDDFPRNARKLIDAILQHFGEEKKEEARDYVVIGPSWPRYTKEAAETTARTYGVGYAVVRVEK